MALASSTITLAPLPTIRQLVRALCLPPLDGERLASNWQRPGDSALWFSRSAWSLAAIACLRKAHKHKTRICVWLPDFFCNSSLSLLRDQNVELVFYAIDENLHPEEDDFQELVNRLPPDLFLIVHYFGQATPISTGIRFLCNQHNAWLIEDAAHVLRPIKGVGEAGDFVLYSPHKHLPLPDGAVLMFTARGAQHLADGAQVISQLTTIRRDLRKRYLHLYSLSAEPWAWLFKRIMQQVGIRCIPPTISFKHDLPSSIQTVSPRMSTLGRRLLAPLLADLEAFGRQRKELDFLWDQVIQLSGTQATRIPRAAAPYLAGFRLPSGLPIEEESRRSILKLHRAGMPFTTWPDLPPEVVANPERHATAIRLRSTDVYLPLHASVSPKAAQRLTRRMLISRLHGWQIEAIDRTEWRELERHCTQVNMLQTWEYGEAKRTAEGWQPKRFCIRDQNKKPVAIVQVLLKRLYGFGYVARINRGPLLLEGSMNPEMPSVMASKAIALLRESMRKQGWRLLTIAPEMLDTWQHRFVLKALGFKKRRKMANWTSGRLELKKEDKVLLKELKSNWRNKLRKSQEIEIAIKEKWLELKEIEALIQNYQTHQQRQAYTGIPERLVRAICMQQTEDFRLCLFACFAKNDILKELKCLGQVVTVHAGDTATYLIGLATPAGRQAQANTALLWHAILHAKHQGCAWFDVGGLGEGDTANVSVFKRGLNAAEYSLVGEWWS